MATYERLRKLFTDLTLATIAMHAVACAETTAGPGTRGIGAGSEQMTCTTTPLLDLDMFTVAGCEPNTWLAAIRPSMALDYLALRRPPRFDGETGPVIIAEAGTQCATASAPIVCVQRGDEGTSRAGFGFFRSDVHDEDEAMALVWTRGDEFGAVTTREGLVAFLERIDSAEKALLLGTLAYGHDPSCVRNARQTEYGFEILSAAISECDGRTTRRVDLLGISTDGSIRERTCATADFGGPSCMIGRLTTGIDAPGTSRTGDLGDWFAEMAQLEACAVFAFMRLAAELDALGAPEDLIARARVAADDETRHAREVAALAIVFGGVVAEIADPPTFPLRDAFAIALENASEGCVRETYGALVATHQARTATDARVRDVLARIAVDETNHAAFSWDLAEWLDGVLDASQRAHVADERIRAVARFRGARDNALSADARAAVGLPDDATSRALFAGLEASVWA